MLDLDFGYVIPLQTNKISMSNDVRILHCMDVNNMTFSRCWVLVIINVSILRQDDVGMRHLEDVGFWLLNVTT